MRLGAEAVALVDEREPHHLLRAVDGVDPEAGVGRDEHLRLVTLGALVHGRAALRRRAAAVHVDEQPPARGLGEAQRDRRVGRGRGEGVEVDVAADARREGRLLPLPKSPQAAVQPLGYSRLARRAPPLVVQRLGEQLRVRGREWARRAPLRRAEREIERLEDAILLPRRKMEPREL